MICKKCEFIYDKTTYNNCPVCNGIKKIEKLFICPRCNVAYQGYKCPVCQLQEEIDKGETNEHK